VRTFSVEKVSVTVGTVLKYSAGAWGKLAFLSLLSQDLDVLFLPPLIHCRVRLWRIRCLRRIFNRNITEFQLREMFEITWV
jgi:hypothetical protein